MASYITEHRKELSKTHYILKADADNKFWFNVAYRKLEQYKAKFGNDFCIVLFGSVIRDDAYVMPFARIKELFRLDEVDGSRWVGDIDNGILSVRTSPLTMAVTEFHNAYHQLKTE